MSAACPGAACTFYPGLQRQRQGLVVAALAALCLRGLALSRSPDGTWPDLQCELLSLRIDEISVNC